MVTLLVLVCVAAPLAYADFWAGIGPGIEGTSIIQKYDSNGTYTGISVNTGVADVRKLSYYDGYVYGVAVGPGTVRRWSDATGALDESWSISAGLPFNIAFDSIGKLYLSVLGAAQNVNQVFRYDRETGTLDGWSTSGQAMTQPGGIAFDADGRVYVADGASSVVRFNLDGTFESVFATGKGLNITTALAFDSAGKLYVGNWMNSYIRRWSADGVYEGALICPDSFQDQIGFQGDQLFAKYYFSGSLSCVPGDVSGGVISGTWAATDDISAGCNALVVVPNTVPEPAGIASLFMGLAGLGGAIRLRKK
jgi:DNA-binding beta-propeller fold protein YncE